MLSPVAHVCVHVPVLLNDGSAAIPDLAICHPDPYDDAHGHLDALRVFLLIEVADTSLAYHRTHQAEVYAVNAIPIYWMVNLEARRVEVFSNPDVAGGRYERQILAYAGESLALPGSQALAVADIFPRSESDAF